MKLSLDVSGGRRRVAIVALSPSLELDITGPLSVFQNANAVLKGRGRNAEYLVEVVSAAETTTVAGDCGLGMVAHRRITAVRGVVDTVLVAGGSAAVGAAAGDPVVRWLPRMARRARRVGSICTGAFVLAAAGLLDGRRATTHWLFCEELARLYPKVGVDPAPIFVRDGAVCTSAGVTAGIDLALELVEEDLGGEIALAVARTLVVYLRRPGGQAQFSVALSTRPVEHRAFRDLQAWIVEHLAEPLRVEDLAARAAMSPRNFARAFAAEVGATPARYVLLQRMEAAKAQLEQSARGQEEIAVACGFGAVEQLRRAFLRELSTTPGRYRDHFRRKGGGPRGPASKTVQRALTL